MPRPTPCRAPRRVLLTLALLTRRPCCLQPRRRRPGRRRDSGPPPCPPPHRSPRLSSRSPARETRVILTRQGIDVDNVALFALSEQRGRDKFRRTLPSAQAADVPLIARSAVRLTAWKPVPEHAPPPGALDLPALRPILDRAAAVDRANGASPEIPLRLYAPADAPYGLVTRAMVTAAAAADPADCATAVDIDAAVLAVAVAVRKEFFKGQPI